jgi:hypothetical protein
LFLQASGWAFFEGRKNLNLMTLAQEGSVFVHYAAFLIKKCKNRILKNQITCLIIQGNIWNLCKWCVTCAALPLSFHLDGSGAAFAFFFSAGLWVGLFRASMCGAHFHFYFAIFHREIFLRERKSCRPVLSRMAAFRIRWFLWIMPPAP